jgi:acyl-coenzyme A thioesterase PaaI-like protein
MEGHGSIPHHSIVSQTVTDLPFNRFLGIESAADDTKLLHLPSGSQYLNHLGTVHASALLALAEASSGEFLLKHFGDGEGLIPVVRHLEAKFRKPANGAVSSTATVPEGALDALNAGLTTKGRALITVSVDLHDESGAHVLSASVEWFIQRVNP